MTYHRMAPVDREAAILRAAVEVAQKDGFTNLKREAVALRAECTASLVTMRFGSMDALRAAVFREAVRTKNLPLIAQGLVSRMTFGCRVPAELKEQALASLTH